MGAELTHPKPLFDRILLVPVKVPAARALVFAKFEVVEEYTLTDRRSQCANGESGSTCFLPATAEAPEGLCVQRRAAIALACCVGNVVRDARWHQSFIQRKEAGHSHALFCTSWLTEDPVGVSLLNHTLPQPNHDLQRPGIRCLPWTPRAGVDSRSIGGSAGTGPAGPRLLIMYDDICSTSRPSRGFTPEGVEDRERRTIGPKAALREFRYGFWCALGMGVKLYEGCWGVSDALRRSSRDGGVCLQQPRSVLPSGDR